MKEDEKKLLKKLVHHPVFSTLNEVELGSINGLLRKTTLAENELLFAEEEEPQFMYFVLEGELKVTLVDDSIRIIGPGKLLGEIGLLHGGFRAGVVNATKDTQLISICGTRLFNPKYVPAEIALKIVRMLAKRSVGYFINTEQSSTLTLIANGESDHVEFKSTLRSNIHSKGFDKRLELASIKTIAAFLNASGGTLFIGVNDDGEVLGLTADRFPNEDKFMLHLMSLIKTSMGELSLQYVKLKVAEIGDKQVLRVDCRPSKNPVYVKWQNDEKFYVRSGPSTISLVISSVHEYIRNRFPD